MALTDLQQRFCEEYVSGEHAGKGGAALVAAGYSENGARQTAWKMLRHSGVRAEIDRLTREALGDHASASVVVLRQILDDPRTDKDFTRLRLDAAKAILDRAGFVAPKAPDAPEDPAAKPMRNWSIAELDAFISDTQAKIAAMSAPTGP